MKRRVWADGSTKPWADKPGPDFAEKLAAAITGTRGVDPSKIAKALGASSVAEVIAAPPPGGGAAFPTPAPSSEAKSRAVEARRNAAAEPAEELPKRPKKRHPTEPTSSPAREKLLRATRVKAPLYCPAQFSKADYAIARFTVGGSGAELRAQQVAQTAPRMLYHSIKNVSLYKAELEEIPEYKKAAPTGERSDPKTAKKRKRYTRVTGWRKIRDWNDGKARALTAIAITLFRMAGPTKRRGMNRMTPGVTIPMLCTLVHQDNGEPYSVDYMCELTDDLARAGVFYKEQPPADEADPATVGPSGWATNVYYFTDRACSAGSPRELAQKPLPAGNDAPGTPPARRTTSRATADPPAPS